MKLVAVRVMAVTAGLVVLRSKLNWIFRPPFSKAVMGGIAGGDREWGERLQPLIIEALTKLVVYGAR